MQKLLNQINDLFSEKLLDFQTQNPNQIFNEMLEYSFFQNSGKKLRPILGAIFALNYFHLKLEEIIDFLIGIELVHNYSLVHDDLPALDNDDFRRGMSTIHKKFGEYNAILFGDALQSLAFEFFSRKKNFEDQRILKVIKFFSETIGPKKLIYGQNLDLEFSKKNQNLNLEIIQKIHKNKTAVFFGFCSSFSGILSGASSEIIKKTYDFGENFGLAFQILDDIEDFENPNKENELNILKFLSKEKTLEILSTKIEILQNFIQNEVELKNQKIFFEFIEILQKKIN
jgi:geranylgeranyl diphosphate synthase type II